MYSIVMVAAMAGAPEAPACHLNLFHCKKHSVACAPPCAPAPVACAPAPVACAPACEPVAHKHCGFCGLGIGHKLKSCFGGLCHKPAPCHAPVAVVTECNACPTVEVAPAVVPTPVPHVVPTPVPTPMPKAVPVPTPMPKVIPTPTPKVVPTPEPKVIPTPTPKATPKLGPTPDVKPAVPESKPKVDVKAGAKL